MTTKSVVRLLILVLTAVGASAVYADTVRVTGSRLNIRGAAAIDGPVLAVADRGDVLDVVSLEGDWYAVRVPGTDRVGYVHRSFVEPTDAMPSPPPLPPAPSSVRATPPPPQPSPRARPTRFTLFGSYVLGTGSTDISATTNFSLYSEDTGRLSETYDYDAASGFDLGARGLLLGSFGLEASYAISTRTGTADVSLRLPHPLYLDEPRELTPTMAEPEVEEKAIHVGLVAAGDFGLLRAGAYAGPSFYTVTADLLRDVTFAQSYPYDTEDTSVSAAPLTSIEASAVGFHAGAFAEVVLHPNIGVGVDARFTRATVELERPAAAAATTPDDPGSPRPVQPDAGTLDLEVGGFQLLGGLRLYF